MGPPHKRMFNSFYRDSFCLKHMYYYIYNLKHRLTTQHIHRKDKHVTLTECAHNFTFNPQNSLTLSLFATVVLER